MIAVLGAGSWGTALSISFAEKQKVMLWHRDKEYADNMKHTSCNSKYLPEIKLPENIDITSDLEHAIKVSEIVFIAVPSSALEDILQQIKPFNPQNIVLCSKGFAKSNLGFYSDLASQILPNSKIAVLSGPNFALEVAKKLPTVTSLASKHKEFEQIASKFSTDTFLLKYTDDIIGTQLLGALKNIYAIGAGYISKKYNSENTMAAYLTKATLELQKLLEKYDGKAATIFEPAGIGDLFLTCGGKTSRNFRFGYNFEENPEPSDTVEGLVALKIISDKLGNHIANFELIYKLHRIIVNKEQLNLPKGLI